MTRMAGPDCAVMRNLINTRTHHAQAHTKGMHQPLRTSMHRSLRTNISHYVQARIGHFVQPSSVVTYYVDKVNAKQAVVKVLAPGHT